MELIRVRGFGEGEFLEGFLEVFAFFAGEAVRRVGKKGSVGRKSRWK